VLGDIGLMGDQQHRETLLVQLLEDRHHLDAGARVEVAGGLVRQEQGGAVHQRPRDGDPLLLATGELRRGVVEPVRETDALQRFRRASVPLARGDALVEQGSSTFSSALVRGSRLKPWKTNPICSPRTRAS